ncbi:MAG: glycosyltransferase family 4 protein [Syntrophobacteraceae bacterium]
MAALLSRMVSDTDHAFACVTFGKVREVQASHDDRIDCFLVPGDLAGRSLDGTLRLSCDLVNQWKPDLIHVHGTEGVFGLLTARNMVTCPTVVSLQGLLGPYSNWYRYFGNSSFMDIVRMHRWLEIAAGRGLWRKFLVTRKIAKREREIIAGNRFFMGRTSWDRAYIRAMNPSAQYFHGGELLREAFWRDRWSMRRAQRHRIIFTNGGGYPRKGTETLLEAVKLLKPHFPEIQVGIAGGISPRSGYGRYVRRRIAELGNVATELGPLTAEEMVKEMVNSHVFVSPSYIDNSPNAVCEAQLLGMPVVSTYTGGLPSLIDEGRTGLFVPTGDGPMLAARLRELFEDDSLAVRLGRQAYEVAVRRHDPDAIVHEVVAAYEQIIGKPT